MPTYVLNTIAFKDQLEAGRSQAELVKQVKKLGFDAIEIRNEFLTGDEQELIAIAKQATDLNLETYYSVNDNLVEGTALNHFFEQYLHEMRLLNATHLKMNIGKIDNLNFSVFVKRLSMFLDGSFELDLENNQTLADSSLQSTKAFFNLISQSELKQIHYCFDIANWYWLDVSPEVAADALAPLTTYLHLKNAKDIDGGLTVVSLEEGKLDWRKLVAQFDEIDSFGLEYAGDTTTVATDLQRLKELVE